MSFWFPKFPERLCDVIQLLCAELMGHSIDPVKGKQNYLCEASVTYV